MRLHNPPDLEFRRDKGFERADRIQRILDEVTGRRGNAPGHEEGGGDE
jgi:ribosome-binding factor A